LTALPQTNFEERFGIRFLPGHVVHSSGRTRDSQDIYFLVPFPSHHVRFFDGGLPDFLKTGQGFDIHLEDAHQLIVGEHCLFHWISLFFVQIELRLLYHPKSESTRSRGILTEFEALFPQAHSGEGMLSHSI
jgi:hypothetical protein